VYTLSEERFLAEAAPALHRIFVHEDPFDQPFASTAEERRLLYPVDCVLGRRQTQLLDIIISSAKAVGDSGCYLSITWRPAPQDQDEPYHWYFHVSEIDEYRGLKKRREHESLYYAYILEHVLYSPSGQWGIMISLESHALLGCSSVFLSSMHRAIPGFDDLKQILPFLSDWKYYATKRGADVSWIPGLLTQTYGAQTAQQLLAEASFTDLL
jgi:hypothetical protein